MEPREYCYSSGVKTASAQISDKAGYFYGIILTTDGTTDTVVSFYDNTVGSGTKFLPDMTFATTADLRDHKILLPFPVNFDTGCYITATGGTFGYTVLYRKRM